MSSLLGPSGTGSAQHSLLDGSLDLTYMLCFTLSAFNVPTLSLVESVGSMTSRESMFFSVVTSTFRDGVSTWQGAVVSEPMLFVSRC